MQRILSLVSVVVFISLTGCKWYLPWNQYNDGYAPDQPIAFDHSLHAGQYQINCRYCHSNVEKSRHASVPSGDVCMKCHIQVATDRPEIKKVQEAVNSGRAVQWVKIHMLPDYVHFNHAIHVAPAEKGGRSLDCTSCHGEVQKMKIVHQEKPLAMGWCLECHRQPDMKGPQNCTACHY